MKRNKSAKDLAFDRERARLRKEIRILENENHQLTVQLVHMNNEVEKAQGEIRNLKEWNERLLQYIDMPEEEMRKRIENERTRDQIFEHFKEINNILGGLKIL